MITPQEILNLLQAQKYCVFCHCELDWNAKRVPHLHHNHETGRVIGFVDERCNIVEAKGKTEEASCFRALTDDPDDTSNLILNGYWINGPLRGQPVK